MDQFIGRDHLFKKSIILIKAWCYYESRTLGAPHGLISTYALETLVLCIINLFHSSLSGPLQVFHRFLEYYGNFDWQKYCISIYGPVSLSSIDKIREILENDGENFLLPKEFVKSCKAALSDPRKVNEARMQEFPIKHLNVVDPLKDNNNLGRSVTSGNFKRIKSAFALGSKQLKEILALPGESIGKELQTEFFMSTVDRNGRGRRPDLQTPVPAFGSGKSIACELTGDYEYYHGAILYAYALHGQNLHPSPQPCLPPSQVQNNTAWSPRTWSPEQVNWNIFDQMPMNLYASPFRHCASPQIDNTRTRGTGTYIPGQSPHYKLVQSKGRGKPEFKTRRVTVKPAQKGNQNEVIPGTNVTMKPAQKGNQIEVISGTNTGVVVSSSDLALEEFPQLPGTQLPLRLQVDKAGRTWASLHPRVPLHTNEDQADQHSQVDQAGKTWASLQPQVPPHTDEDRNPGVLGSVPLPSEMHPPETKADSCSFSTQVSKSKVPVVRKPSQQGEIKLGNEDVLPSRDEVNKEEYQLKDDKDFPPLGSKTKRR